MPRRRCAGRRRLAEELLVPEFQLLLHEQAAEARGPGAERRRHEPWIVAIDGALHDTVSAILARLAFAPVPIVGFRIDGTLDHLLCHSHQRIELLRIDRVLDYQETVVVELPQLFGSRCGVGHGPRVAGAVHAKNVTRSSSDATESSVCDPQ